MGKQVDPRSVKYNGEYGVIASLYNGLCLAIPVLIILKIIDTINDRKI